VAQLRLAQRGGQTVAQPVGSHEAAETGARLVELGDGALVVNAATGLEADREAARGLRLEDVLTEGEVVDLDVARHREEVEGSLERGAERNTALDRSAVDLTVGLGGDPEIPEGLPEAHLGRPGDLDVGVAANGVDCQIGLAADHPGELAHVGGVEVEPRLGVEHQLAVVVLDADGAVDVADLDVAVCRHHDDEVDVPVLVNLLAVHDQHIFLAERRRHLLAEAAEKAGDLGAQRRRPDERQGCRQMDGVTDQVGLQGTEHVLVTEAVDGHAAHIGRHDRHHGQHLADLHVARVAELLLDQHAVAGQVCGFRQLHGAEQLESHLGLLVIVELHFRQVVRET